MPKKVPPSSAFGERLMRLRLARGFTQTQLADKIGSSQRAVSRYETVAEFPPTHIVVEIAHALDVSTDELLGLGRAKKVAAPNGTPQDPESRRLWRKFQQIRALPEKDQRAVIRLLNSLVASAERRPVR